MTGPTDDRSLPGTPSGDAQPDRAFLALLLAHQRRDWGQEGRVPVETYLAEEPGLRDDPEAILDLIYHEILLREEHGESAQLEEYLRRFPELAPQLELQFEVERALGPRTVMGTVGGGTLPAGAAPLPAALARRAVPGYELLGELGRGGMGVVYRAQQVRLNRIVALKMILASNHAAPEAAARFVAEAEVVARLSHPHIIQIFAFGDHDGNPYFEMEYAAGGSLADRLDGTPWPARDAARLIETLARAIHEVHRLGIVHRDLKPANILLTADGTPKVADFGLAKWLDVESGLTRTDHILGSPSYMAPEQAGGGATPIGPAADVYALGAILYELLTGRPPFRAATAFETLEQVKSVEPVSPARLRPGLPRDLETMCLKSLRKEPAGRYASAAELAEDLRRFGAGEPIRARPVGAPERAWRWCRREPVQAALAAALVAGFLGVAMQWWRAEGHLSEVRHQRALLEANFRREVAAHRALQEAHARERAALAREQEAHTHEQEARRRAQERFQLGMEAVDGYSTLAGEGELLNDPQLQGLRKRLLGTALKFYVGLQKSLETDPAPRSRFQLSDAYSRVAILHREMGSKQEALADYRQALAISEAVVAAEPANHRYQASVARTHVRLGEALREIGRLDDAMRSVERGLAIQEVLVRDQPTIAKYKSDLAWCLVTLGTIQKESGRPDEAVPLYERALPIREALARVDPTSPRLQHDVANNQHNLGLIYDDDGRPDEALRWVGRAVAAYEELVRAHPLHAEYRRSLAMCLADLGAQLRRIGNPGAGPPMERSVAIREALVRENPASVRYQVDLTSAYLYLATVRAAAGLRDEALVNLRKAEQIVERSADVHPHTLYNLACVYAQYSAAARPGGGDLTPAERAEREAYADRAMAALRRAVTSGYSDLVALMRRDLDLDPLRPRRDFQELVLDLSFPADPFQR